MSKPKPILFSGPMVRAILDGRKTQTRRVVKPQPLDDYGGPWRGEICGPEWYTPEVEGRHGELVPGKPMFGIYTDDWGVKIPWPPGTRLWVREIWRVHAWSDEPEVRIQYAAGGYELFSGEQLPDSFEDWAWAKVGTAPHGDCHWRPSIFMPRWASRIDLEVTGVRCERVQEISAADCVAEGIQAQWMVGYHGIVKAKFRNLWDAINGKKHPWTSNPLVRVYEFRRLKP